MPLKFLGQLVIEGFFTNVPVDDTFDNQVYVQSLALLLVARHLT